MILIEDIVLVLRRTEKRKSHVTGHKQPPMFQILPRTKCGETRGEGGVRYGGFISLSAVVGASYFLTYLQVDTCEAWRCSTGVDKSACSCVSVWYT